MCAFFPSPGPARNVAKGRLHPFVEPSGNARFLRIADVHGGIVAQQETSPEAFRLLDTLSTRGPERIRMEPADSGREASPR
jgi:hypothetical protein